jgi:hypothetical protein
MSSRALASTQRVLNQATRDASPQRVRAGPPLAGWIPPIVRDVLRSPGEQLDQETRTAMELHFARDFTRVRLHTDEVAAQSANAVGAQAYTVGRHVVFGSGAYAPHTVQGRRLLAHELTHTLQQVSHDEAIATAMIVDDDSTNSYEVEAMRTAAGVTEEGRLHPGRLVNSLPSLALQRAPVPIEPTPSPSLGKTLELEFSAFIPGSLGRPFKDYAHPKDLKNQSAFDAMVAAVTGTWLKEPGEVVSKNWYYATDNREFGGGSHRLGFKGRVSIADIGRLGPAKVFSHWADPSRRVAAIHTGIFTSKGEIGSLDGPHSRTASVKGSEEPPSNALDRSTVDTKASAAYAFMSIVAPDIDYDVKWTFRRATGNQVLVSVDGEHNLFPFYEAIVNRQVIYTFSSADPGPNLRNLNKSTKFSVKERPF